MRPPRRSSRPTLVLDCRVGGEPQLRGVVFGEPRYRPYWNASFIDGSSGNSDEAQQRYRAAIAAIFRCMWVGDNWPGACWWYPACGPLEEVSPRGGGLVATTGLVGV